MKRFNTIFALSILGLVSLTACGEEAKNVTDAAKDATGSVTNVAKDAAGKTTDAAGKVGDAAKDTAGKTVDAAKDATGKTVDTAKDTAGKTTDAAKGAVDKAMGMAGNLAGIKDGVLGMKGGVATTLTAVKAGDFAKAQTEATKLQTSWGKISETVEKQSGAGGSYKTINDGLKTVQTSLKDAKPDKVKITSQLQSVATAVTGLLGPK
jgi:hypothetical protein